MFAKSYNERYPIKILH